MFRYAWLLFVAAILGAGCVPVAEPVGDVNKAEPDKDLIGTWIHKDKDQWIVDRPEVKGNPKGLMRITVVEVGKKKEDAKAEDVMWFFTTKIGKHTYASLLLDSGSPAKYPALHKEGAYAEWGKNEKRGYWIGLLTLKDDTLTLDGGDKSAFDALMTKEKVATRGEFSQTPPGWLAKYLEKNGPDAIFKNTNELVYQRAKK